MRYVSLRATFAVVLQRVRPSLGPHFPQSGNCTRLVATIPANYQYRWDSAGYK
jgi:hypothetical protein